MRRLALVLVGALAGMAAFAAPPTPTTLEINCDNVSFQTTPFNCNFLAKPQPQFRFNGTTGCNRYQIQVDKVSTFSGAPWFWDSGTQTATCTATTTATFPSSSNGGSTGNGPDDLPNDGIAGQTMWAGQRRFYWRVRVSDDGGSSWSAYSTASSGAFSVNTYPMMPEPLSVANGSGGGSVDSTCTTTSGTTLHAAVTDQGAGNCTSAANACDLAQAIAAAVDGDTIMMASGSYSAPSFASADAGSCGKPITLTKESAATPTINSGTLDLTKAYWTVDGLTFTQTSGALLDYSATNLIVRNSTFTGTGQTTVAGEGTSIIFGGSASNYFLNNTVAITSTTYNVLLPQAGADRTIRGNDISTNGSRAIKKGGDETTMGGNLLITDNYIHDLTGNDGGSPLSFYYASGHVYMARNYIRGGSNAGGYVIQFVRGAWPHLRNNTFQAEGDEQRYCAQFNQNDGKPIIENLACISTSIAFAMLSPDAWNTTNKVQLENSAIRRNGGGTVDRTNNTSACASDGTTCFDFTSVQWSTADLAFSSGRPTASSTVTINNGVTGQAIPTGAAAPIDIGRFEYQATTGTATSVPNGVYDYQSQWTVNTTPRISWTFVDGDNTLMSAGQTQSAYEVQIDPTTYFNSSGDWKPYCSSGIVSSTNAYWDVPSGCALAGGTKYYFRVRTWDNVASATTSNAGTWSDYVNAFTTTAGTSYYVAASGGSDSNDGSIGSPFATWPKAISVAVAGDTIYGRSGTHTVPYFRIEPGSSNCGPSSNLSCGASGTSGSPITYTNYNGESVILDTTNSSNPHGLGVGIDNHGNYIVFRGLKVTGAPEEGLDNRGDNVTVDQCEFYDNSTETSQNNVQVEDGADNFTLTRSKLYWTSGFVSSVPECAGHTDDRPCTAHNLYLQGSNQTVMNNFIYDTLGEGRDAADCTGSGTPYACCTGVGAGATCTASGTASNAYGVQIGSTGLTYSGTVFAYNTIANTATRAGLVLYAGGGGSLTNIDVYNNIIKASNSVSDSGTGSIYAVTGATSENLVNNIYDTSASPSGFVLSGGSTPTQSGNITGSVAFFNYVARDLHLNATSSIARDAASATVTVAVDYDGDARPINGLYDIGADESAATGPPPAVGKIKSGRLTGGSVR